MAGLCFLDRVHREEADGVDAVLFELVFLTDGRLVALLGDRDRGRAFSGGRAGRRRLLFGGLVDVLAQGEPPRERSRRVGRADYTRRTVSDFPPQSNRSE